MPPPPKPDAIRRNARVGPVQLPAEGRKGAPPEWPLHSAMSVTEQATWDYLWTLPQAVMWEKTGQHHVIARYCRLLVVAENMSRPSAVLHAQITALEDKIGMNPKAMRTLMWAVADDEVAQKRAETASTDVRRRLKAVD